MGGNSGRKVKPAQSTARPAKLIKRSAVRKSRPASQDDYWVQPADGVVLVDVGPTEKDLEDARARIRAGEDRDRVINELVGKVLDARVEMKRRKVQDLTDKLQELDKCNETSGFSRKTRRRRLISVCRTLRARLSRNRSERWIHLASSV